MPLAGRSTILAAAAARVKKTRRKETQIEHDDVLLADTLVRLGAHLRAAVDEKGYYTYNILTRVVFDNDNVHNTFRPGLGSEAPE